MCLRTSGSSAAGGGGRGSCARGTSSLLPLLVVPWLRRHILAPAGRNGLRTFLQRLPHREEQLRARFCPLALSIASGGVRPSLSGWCLYCLLLGGPWVSFVRSGPSYGVYLRPGRTHTVGPVKLAWQSIVITTQQGTQLGCGTITALLFQARHARVGLRLRRRPHGLPRVPRGDPRSDCVRPPFLNGFGLNAF